MKKILFTLVTLVLALGLSLPMAGPVMAAPDTLTVVSDTSVEIIGIYNKSIGPGPEGYVDLSLAPLSAVRAQEPKPYPTGYAAEPPEVTDSVWDLGVSWSFQTNAPDADWIWETERSEYPATIYDSENDLYDPNPSSNGRVVVFRKIFEIDGTPTAGTLRITADNCYEVWINGTFVARSATAKVAGWEETNLQEPYVGSSGWQTVGNYDVSSFLVSGENTLIILAANEYYHPSNSTFEFNNSPSPPYVASPYRQQNPAAMIFSMAVEYDPAPSDGRICGYKYEDFREGAKFTENPLEDWDIFLFDRQLEAGEIPSEALDGFVATTSTGEDGGYCFENLPYGTYYVYELIKDGWAQVTGGANYPATAFYQVILTAESHEVDGKNFVNRLGIIRGFKYNDLDGSGGSPGAGELPLPGWTIFLYKDNPAAGEPNGIDAFKTTVTNALGGYQFDGLYPATYYVYEMLENGWVQTHPASGFYTVNLTTAGQLVTGRFFGNMEADYQICGFKYADWEGAEIPLPDWTINLEKWVDEAWVPVTSVDTNENGKYCFPDLEAGEYRVSETFKDGWDQVSPANNEYLVTLPCGASDPAEGPFYNFHNTPHLYCFDETAWAAAGEPATTRFVPAPGNWATFVGYTIGSGTEETPAEFPLYAGQTYLAGTLYVYDVGGTLFVKYVASGEAGDYTQEGYCEGTWTGLTEYHLQVVDAFVDFDPYRAYNQKTGQYGAPIPGQFDVKWEGDKVAETGWIEVDITIFETPIYLAAHAVMWWCGYDCDVLAEIESAME